MTVDNQPIRILWLTPDKPENISVGRHRIAKELSTRGFEVTVRGTTPLTVWRCLGKRGEYDAVLGTTRSGAIAATLIGRLSRIPVVVDHIDPIRQLYQTHPSWLAWVVERLETIAFRLAAHVLYVYDEEENRISSVTDTYSKTDLGVDYDRFANPDDAVLQAANDQLSALDLNENIVMYVGGLEPIYNIEPMIDAMDHLSEWSLIVAGTGSLESTVADRAAGRDDIEYLGVVPHETVPGYLHQADVGVSLVDDPHTLKVLEYLATSVPAVQLDGRARNRFGDIVTYSTIDPFNIAQAIADANTQTIGQTEDEFAQKFTWSSIAADYEEVLLSLNS